MAYKDNENQKKYAKEHYQKNKSKYISRAIKHKKKKRIEIRSFINDYLSSHPCVDCGENDTIVLEFDHVHGGKLGNIGDFMSKGWGLKSIQKEILKCEVRCANCHRRVTHKRRKEI